MGSRGNQIRRQLRLLLETDDAEYPGRVKLRLRGKDLLHIPQEMFGLTEIEVLELSPDREACLHYQMGKLGGGLGRLVNLTILILDTNALTHVPHEISTLVSLERLTLSNNFLKSLPDGIGNLTKLTSLHLTNNVFPEFPQVLLELESLQFLDMSDNHLRTLPDGIDRLKKLETLMLYINHLERLPESICNLTDLITLWVGKNNLRSLPKKFGNLKRLEWGRNYISAIFDENPLQNPPIEICRLGPQAVGRYFAGRSHVKDRK